MSGERCEWDEWNACLLTDLALPGAVREPYPDEGTADIEAQAVKDLEEMLVEFGQEAVDGNLLVYLGTASRILPDTLHATDLMDISTLTRSQMSEKVRRAFDEPLAVLGRPGRTRAAHDDKVEKIVVVKERHASGEVHCHWAIKFFGKISSMIDR